MRWSNFLLTVNTNVCPHSHAQKVGMTQWLYNQCQNLLWDFDSMNGVLIKPAGSLNMNEEKFSQNHKIAGVKSSVTIEQGEKRHFMHAHVLIEICHNYVEKNEYGYSGVHLNRKTIQDYFDSHIGSMPINEGQRPEKHYINVRLLTRENDNTSKWLTLSYINKDKDLKAELGVPGGRNLKRDRAAAKPADLHIRKRFKEDSHQIADFRT